MALETCPVCGWQMIRGFDHHGENCKNAVAGQAADKLIAALGDIESRKHGYGDRTVAFKLGDDFTMQLGVNYAGTFFAERIWLHDRLSVEETADLIRALDIWYRIMKAARR